MPDCTADLAVVVMACCSNIAHMDKADTSTGILFCVCLACITTLTSTFCKVLTRFACLAVLMCREDFDDQPSNYRCPQCNAPKRRFVPYDKDTGKVR